MSQITLPLDFDLDGCEIKRASEITFQINEHETIISFFAVDPPLVVGTPKEQEAKMKKLKSIKARCIARLAIPTSKLAQFQSSMPNGSPGRPMKIVHALTNNS